MTNPVAPLTTAAKLAAMGVGAAAGLGAVAWSETQLSSPARTRELDSKGIGAISDKEFTLKASSLALFTAAAIGTGIGRRNPSAALTTASLGAAAMLASPALSGMINADGEQSDKYARTLGLMLGAGAVGYAIGAMDEVPLNAAKLGGLALIGFVAAGLLPATLSYLGGLPGDIGRSVEHSDK